MDGACNAFAVISGVAAFAARFSAADAGSVFCESLRFLQGASGGERGFGAGRDLSAEDVFRCLDVWCGDVGKSGSIGGGQLFESYGSNLFSAVKGAGDGVGGDDGCSKNDVSVEGRTKADAFGHSVADAEKCNDKSSAEVALGGGSVGLDSGAGGSLESGVTGDSVGGGVRTRGQRKRDQLRRQRERRKAFGVDEVVSGEFVASGRCETVVSAVPVVVPVVTSEEKVAKAVPVWRRKQGDGSCGVPAVKEVGTGDSLRDAEKLARESLARRRAAENAVAVRMAELKLRSLNDEKKCQDYEDLKRQRIIQWQNQALAKSQSSAKSLDPDSSVSMREFRELGKKNADLEYEKKVYMDVIRKKCGDRALLDAVNMAAPMGSETEAEMQMAAEDCADLDGDIPWIRENRVAC